MDRNYQYFWCLVFCFLFLVAFSSLTSITKAGERCSKITGKCFEWPIIADNTTMERMPTNGIWSKPDGEGPYPAVLIVESCGGSKPAVNKMWPAFFNSIGYVTYTPRILETLGKDYCPSLQFVAKNENRAKMVSVIYSALDDLSEKPHVQKDNIGIIGFSLGGLLIRDAGEVINLRSSKGLQFKYTIPVYGNCTLLERRGGNIPTLIIQAEKEKPKKRDLCLKVRDTKFQNVIYHEIPGAYHAFDDSQFTKLTTDMAGNKMLYSSDALTASKKLIKNFLAAQH